MKKVLMLPIFAVIALVSQAWAADPIYCQEGGKDVYCKWGTNSCSRIDAANGSATAHEDTGVIACGNGNGTCTCENLIKNCKAYGAMYGNSTCTGELLGGNDPDAAIGFCRWNGSTTECGPIYNQEEKTNCHDENVYSTIEACRNTSSTQSSSSANNNNNQSSSSANNNTQSSSSANNNNTQSSSSANNNNNQSSSSGGTDPIISYNSTPAIGLNVTHFARSLQIASGKDATVFLFDIRGKQIFSQKVLSGTTTISLAGQRQGIYYAVVKAGSQKQTVKIILK